MQFIKQLRDKHYQIDRKILSNNERNIIINNYESKCNICKTQIEDGEIDHITPLANGGSNEDINLQYLCKSCHKQKTKHEKETGEYLKIIDTESSYNNEVSQIMKNPLAHSHAFIESLAPRFFSDDNDNVVNFHIDINKCRKNILYYSEYDYPVFTVMDSPVIYNKDT